MIEFFSRYFVYTEHTHLKISNLKSAMIAYLNDDRLLNFNDSLF